MLNKLIIHLKNIIFFKAVIYIITIIIMVTLIPIVSKDLAKSSQKNKKSYNLLQSSKSKLNTIIDFENNMLYTKDNFNSLIKRAKHQGCIDRTNLINQISSLNAKYNLFEPIFIRISRLFDDEGIHNPTSNVKMNYYEAKIIFKSSHYYTTLMICSELYNMMPTGSIVTNTEFTSIDGLDLNTVSKLNTKTSPGTTEVKMYIQLREIIYEP